MGPTGTGRAFLVFALAHQACRQGHTVRYFRPPRLFQRARPRPGVGSYSQLLDRLARTALHVVDDWGIAPWSDAERRDSLKLADDRHGARSTLLAGQLPVRHWHECIGDLTIADAISAQLVHNAHQLTLTGGSLQKARADWTPSATWGA